MSIRVSSNQMVYGYQKQLNDANTRQTSLLEQGDGSKLHRPSDNPVDYSKFIRYDASLNENEQYTSNVNTGLSWMKTSDASLVNMTNIQTTFKEKSILAANSTNNNTDMAAIAKEMMAEIQEIVSLGNTMQGDSYVFGGQTDLTKPFELSTDEITRGMTKTLDSTQQAYFSGDRYFQNNQQEKNTGTVQQMLVLKNKDDENDIYYLNTLNGKVYTKEFVENGYKDKMAVNQKTVQDGDEVGTFSGWSGSTDVSKYFENTGKIKNAGLANTFEITVNSAHGGGTVPISFATIEQQIVTFSGDNKYVSMVKKNGTTEPTADTVNVTAAEIFGTDLFDDANSGNVASGTAMLNQMLTVHKKVTEGDNLWMDTDGVTIADEAHAQTVKTETKLGARTQLYDSVSTMLVTQNELITKDITDTSSTDVARLAVQLMQEQTIYNMSLSLGARILPQSLADYL